MSIRFAVFKITATNEGVITFSALPHPGESEKLMFIEAPTLREAAQKAAEVLRVIGTQTHDRFGDPDTVLANFPRYVIGQLNDCDDERATFRIHAFEPVPMKPA
jgi:hypothetical protein